MRKWNFLVALVACGFILSPLAVSQQDQDLRKDLKQLRQDMNRVMAANQEVLSQNADLRGRLGTQKCSALEKQINALADSLEYAAGTTVNSVANPITISGEFRIRSGWAIDRDFGASFPNSENEDDNGSFDDVRFRVAFDFDFSKDVTTHFSMQANGLFNNADTPSSNGNLSQVDLYEGWILVRNIFGREELSNKSGRQEIVLGNEFIFGNNDFFSGETHDASTWLWATDSFDLHFIFAKLAITENLNTRDYPYANVGSFRGFDDDEMYALYFTLKTIKNHVLDLFWVYMNGNNGGSIGTLGNGLSEPSNGDAVKGFAANEFYYHTVGFRIGGVFDVAAGLDYNVNLAYQYGELKRTGGTSDVDVDALTFEVEVGLTFNANNNFRIYGRFLYAEGGETNRFGTVTDSGFIPLFPERHAQGNSDDHTAYRARYGIMNIIPMDNVITIQLGLTFDPASDWTVGLTGLWARHDEDVSDGVNNNLSDIGFEIDLFAEYRYSTEATFSAGIGFFFADEGAPYKGGSYAGGNDDVAVLFYVQSRVTF